MKEFSVLRVVWFCTKSAHSDHNANGVRAMCVTGRLSHNSSLLGLLKFTSDLVKILRLESDQILNTNLTIVASRCGSVENADGTVHSGTVHGIAHSSGIGEEREGQSLLNVALEGHVSARGKLILMVTGHDLGNVHQLIHLIVGELNVVAHTGGHTRDEGEEAVHAVLVAGQDDHQVLPLGLHHIEQDLNGLLPVILVIGGVVEVIGLIHKQHTTKGFLDHLLGLRSSVAYILAHKIISSGNHNVALAAVAHLSENLTHSDGHSGLTGTGGTSEAHVEGRNSGVKTQVPAHLIEHKQSSNLTDPLLDGDKAH
mmetsp:Transcript_7904/g.11054  ORF Transcript_7904/g.11054 Transcript_7904/m.11054 type:complete len:312 (-) Transcript_7904:430-1365(-)